MEAGIANLVEAGDTIIVGVNGYFGAASPRWRRAGADVIEVRADWGSTFRTSGCWPPPTRIPTPACSR